MEPQKRLTAKEMTVRTHSPRYERLEVKIWLS